MDVAELKLLVTAQTDQAMGALSGLSNVLGGVSSTAMTIGAAFGAIGGAMGSFFGYAVTQAARAQDVYAQLGAIETSSILRNQGLIDSQAGWVSIANASNKEVAKLTDEHDRLAKQLERNQFMWDHTTKHTETQAAAMAYLRSEISQNDAEMAKALGTHKVWQNAHEAMGKVTHMSRQEIEEFGMAMEKSTRYTKEDTIEAVRWGETFTSINKETMPQAVELAMDLSTAFGRDLRTSVIMVDKALQDPIKGITNLTRIGVQFTQGQQDQIKALMASGKLLEAQKIILQELQIELGGSAQAAGTTFNGALQIAENAIRRFIMPIGEQLLPDLQSFVTMISNVFEHLQHVSPELVTNAAAFAAIATAIGLITTAIGLLLTPIGLVVTAIAGVKLAIDQNWGGLRDTIAGIFWQIKPEIENIKNAISGIMDAFNFKPEEHPEALEAVKNKMAGYSNAFQQVDSDDPKVAKKGGKTKNPGSIISDKDAGDKLYNDNLKSTLETKANEVIQSIKSIIAKIASWAAAEGSRLFQDAFKSIFGIDFSTFTGEIKNVWDTFIKPVLDEVTKNISEIAKNMSGADFGPLIKGLLLLGGAAVSLFAIGATKILEILSKILADLANAIAAISKGDPEGGKKLLIAIGEGVAFVAGVAGLYTLGTALLGIAAGLLAVLWPVALVAAGVALLVFLFKLGSDNNWFGISDFLKNVFPGALSSAGNAVMNFIKMNLLPAINALKVLAQAIALVAAYWLHDSDLAAKAATAAVDLENLQKSWAMDVTGTNWVQQVVQNGQNAINQKPPAVPKTIVPVAPVNPVNPSASISNPTNGMNVKNSNTNTNIVIQKVIVQKPDDYQTIYDETIKEASRRNAEVGKSAFSYA